MVDHSAALPTDIETLHALIKAERSAMTSVLAERDQLAARNAKLEHLIAEIRRAYFGRKSERINDDQLALALEDLEAELAKEEAKDEKVDPQLRTVRAQKRRANRKLSFDHLPHEEVVIEPESKSCPCCGGALHVIGEDTSRRLDKIPAKVRVIITRRPKYACRKCTDGVVQAPAPPRLIEGGLLTEALVADVVVSKHADHLPLYRQAQILARHGSILSAPRLRSGSERQLPSSNRFTSTCSASSSARRSCLPTRRVAPCSILGGARPSPASCGRLRATIGPGAARSRRRLPTDMRQGEARSTPSRFLKASAACCKSTATPATTS